MWTKGLPDDYPTMMDRIANAGYMTEFLGKTDIYSGNHSLTANITAWLRTVPGELCLTTIVLTLRISVIIEQNNQDSSYLLN